MGQGQGTTSKSKSKSSQGSKKAWYCEGHRACQKGLPAHGSAACSELSCGIKMNSSTNWPRMMAMLLKPKANLEFFFALTLFSKLFAFHVCGGEDRLMFF